MKKMVFALMALMAITTSAQADSCTAVLERNERGYDYIVRTFTNYDYYSERAACDESMKECRQELRERRRYDYNANFNCKLEGRRGGDNGRNQCSFDLVTRNGRVIETFSRRACVAANDACYRELVSRNRSGRNLHARCVQSRYSNPGREVTKTCSVDRMGRRGVVETHIASAQGQRGSGVQAKACQKAMRQCERNVVRRQYCSQR
ncbi:hypothetical protein [Halobacteriovorax sp. HLS]|uniref:hypothetical protein n=1 Tax=Halobacteriovorax sp. HLS TaxID=2234000 RepID=UPI000FD781B5|nr:hypothetical protein [Halobacteriovorax sp. HLS]